MDRLDNPQLLLAITEIEERQGTLIIGEGSFREPTERLTLRKTLDGRFVELNGQIRERLNELAIRFSKDPNFLKDLKSLKSQAKCRLAQFFYAYGGERYYTLYKRHSKANSITRNRARR